MFHLRSILNLQDLPRGQSLEKVPNGFLSCISHMTTVLVLTREMDV